MLSDWLRCVDAQDTMTDYGASGRETVFERLAAAKRKILAATQLQFHCFLDDKQIRDAILKIRHAAGETLSALAGEFGLSPQRVFQIVKLSN